jgi:hypothetical protein
VRKVVAAVGTEHPLVFTAFVTIWLVTVTAKQEKTGRISPNTKRAKWPFSDLASW